MCGICGVAGRVDEAVLRRMLQSMAHRGPDDAGLYLDDGGGLGVRRLSIIDLPGGHQPLANEGETLWVVFNGEIYNHRALRARLESRGHRFRTRSDTEVLVHLHEEYGDEAVHLLEGMFAYALWDRQRRRLLLVRDRLGIKPLYYAEVGGALVFASEVKAVLEYPGMRAEVDPQTVDLYLAFQYVPGRRTMFRGVQKLVPGHVLTASDGRVEIRRYWQLVSGALQESRLDEAAEEFAELLRKTVERHLVSDVPVGALLSGGVDSSAVLAMMARAAQRPVSTFTVRFDVPGAYDETVEARAVAERFQTDHHELVVRADAAALLPDLVWHLDEPVADPAALPTYLICRFARHTVPVVLTGEGGDELLAGYPRYRWFVVAQRLRRLLPMWLREGILLPLARVTPMRRRYKVALGNVLSERDDITRYLHWIAGVEPSLRHALPTPGLRAGITRGAPEALVAAYLDGTSTRSADVIHQLMTLDMDTWLVDDLLTKVDKMSMAASVEARVPFLDHRLVEFVASLPLDVKLRNVGSKLLLKRAMRPFLPTATLQRRKHAFRVPVDEWVSGSLQPFVRDTLLSKRAQERGWFEHRGLETLFSPRTAKLPQYGQSVWVLLCLELWARAFLDGDGRRGRM